MDDTRFDALARCLTEGHSRRGLTRLLGGAVLGGPLALRGLAEPEARKKRKKKSGKASCRAGQKRCDGRCIPSGQCCKDAECTVVGQTCRQGACACPDSQKPCAGSCIPNGYCCENRECPIVGQACSFGQCVCPPPRPETCGGQCLARCPDASYARRPDCGCCIKNGFAYTTGVGQCCSDGAAANATCKGRAPGASCDFHEQCASNFCLFGIFGNACQA